MADIPATPAPKAASSSAGFGISWLFSGRAGVGLVALLALLAFVGVLLTDKIFNDGDTFWHLATGDWILRHRAVPTTDPFSYTFVGKPWQAHEWLAEALMALVFRAAGWSGLSVLFAAAFGATALILGTFLRRWLAPGPLIVVLAFALASGAPSLLARPHLLALPLMAGWLFGLLEARERGGAPRWALLPMMLIWANLHGSFVVGLALIGPFALEALLENRARPWPTIRDWGLFGGLAVALGLMTPQGLAGLIFPFKVSGMGSLLVIAEWHSPDFSRIGIFEIAILEALFICLWRGVRVPAIRLLILLGFMHLALKHMRHEAVFALVAAMLLAEPLARARPGGELAERQSEPDTRGRLALAALALIALVAGIVRLSIPLARADGSNAPVSALAAVPPDLARQRVFNAYGFGGYLIFKGVSPYIDGRGDMYGDGFMQAYGAMTLTDPALLKRELDARQVRWTILAAHEPAVAVMDALPGWRRLHSDPFAIVHVREDAR